MNKTQLQLMLAGVMTTVSIPDGLKPAHGTGLDGKPVNSLQLGTSPEHPGKTFGTDAEGNPFVTTKHELFVATQHAAERGHTISAIRKQQ